MFTLHCFITTSNYILIRWKVCKKMKPVGFVLRSPCDAWQSQGQWKQYKMVEVNVTMSMAGMKNIWLNSLHVLSNIRVFATQKHLAVWPVGPLVGYKTIWFKSLHTISNVKVFAMHNGWLKNSWPDEHNWLYKSICYAYGSKLNPTHWPSDTKPKLRTLKEV